MSRVETIKKIWQGLESEATDGLVKRALDIPSSLKTFCTYKCPDRYYGLAFSFHQQVKVDISSLQDLSELKVTLFKDMSFPDSKFLLVQLNSKDSRVCDIFASICANVISSIVNAVPEKEAVRLVVTQMRKWKDIFSTRRNQALSTQEQQGLFGELFFLRKLLVTSIDKSTSIETWLGPEMAPKDFQSDLWAVEVKTIAANNHAGLSINGELQLDESDVEKLFLYNLVVEFLQQDGFSLPELIADIRGLIDTEDSATDAFERKLILYGYFDVDAHSYQERHYYVRKELYFHVKEEFPRIRKEDLKMGVTDVKYRISLEYAIENIVSEENVINTIESYEGVR